MVIRSYARPSLEDHEMFRVRRGRVTSLASAMLRMILTAGAPPLFASFANRVGEDHTLCDPPRPVNTQTPQRSGQDVQMQLEVHNVGGLAHQSRPAGRNKKAQRFIAG